MLYLFILLLLNFFTSLAQTPVPTSLQINAKHSSLKLRPQNTPLENSISLYYYLINNKVRYLCNGYIFHKHKNAILYYDMLDSKSVNSLTYIPVGGVKLTTIKLKTKPLLLAEYNYKKLINENPFSPKVWTSVWNGCDFKCYSQNNYNVLRDGITSEVNEYRRLHGVGKLIRDPVYDSLALVQALENADKEISTPNKFVNLGYFSTLCYKKNCEFTIREIYDKFLLSYDFKNNNIDHIHYGLTQLLWKSTTKFGIGLECKKNLVYIVFLFSPRGNINGQYKKNVLPISKKVVHMYTYFKNSV